MNVISKIIYIFVAYSATGIFDKVVMFGNLAMFNEYLALYAGSSKHGNACLASVA